MLGMYVSRVVTGAAVSTLLLSVSPGAALGASSVSAQGRDRTPPTTPSNLTVTAVTSYTVTLAWSPSTDNSGRFSYVICCGGPNSATVPQTATSFTFTAGLEAGRSYSFRIYAVDAAGNPSRYSNSVSVTLPVDRRPPTTPTVSVTGVGPTHASLSWSSTEDGPNVWYWIYKDGAPILQGTANRSATFALLQPQTTYTFTVRARDFGMNWSPFSAPVSVTTSASNPNDTAPPTAPSNLREDHWDDGEIHLTWDQSTDNFDAQWILRYDVHVNGVLSDTPVGAGRSIVYGQPGMNTITVTAVDTAGNRSAPAAITVTL
jgi:chitodextrinase